MQWKPTIKLWINEYTRGGPRARVGSGSGGGEVSAAEERGDADGPPFLLLLVVLSGSSGGGRGAPPRSMWPSPSTFSPAHFVHCASHSPLPHGAVRPPAIPLLLRLDGEAAAPLLLLPVPLTFLPLQRHTHGEKARAGTKRGQGAMADPPSVEHRKCTPPLEAAGPLGGHSAWSTGRAGPAATRPRSVSTTDALSPPPAVAASAALPSVRAYGRCSL